MELLELAGATDGFGFKEKVQPPEPYRSQQQSAESTPLPAKYLLLYGTHPDSDYLSITKCPACGWLLKIQHANSHFVRDSRGAIVCKDSELAIFDGKVLGRACHPCSEIKDSYSKKIDLKPLPFKPVQPVHALRGSSTNDWKSRSGSSSSKTDYFSSHSSSYRSRSQAVSPPSNSYLSKSRSSGSSSTHHSSLSSPSKGRSGKSSHSSSTTSSSSYSSSKTMFRSSHKSGTYTLSIPSDDMGQNESVEDLLMPNVSHHHGSSKHTVHIIATKSKSSHPNYDHHSSKYYSDVPEKRIKLDSSSSHSSHYHKSPSEKLKPKHFSQPSIFNGSLSVSRSHKSSSSSHTKNESSSPSKHHLRSTSTVTTTSPVVSSVVAPSLSSPTSSHHQHRSHLPGSGSSSSSVFLEREKERDKDRSSSSSSSKKKKRKRDKDEPRKIIPLKDRDFNPDKHCGVHTLGSNVPCKRSLTCKTHSMALRRAVTGRSQSFDALLAAHKLAKTEEKKLQTKDSTEEVVPTKPKKKLSGSGSSPNDLRTLPTTVHVESIPSITYVHSKSPDVGGVKPKPKPAKLDPEPLLKKIKTCPLVYPYTPETQSRFEAVWYNPPSLERNTRMTADEKNKFVFLLKHYKNPFYLNIEVPTPVVAKNPREKRNVVRET